MEDRYKSPALTTALVAAAMLAFAGNSLLTRAALSDGVMGAGAFAGIRLASGAVTLALICLMTGRDVRPRRRDLPAVAALFLYAAFFTLAYRSIGAAGGALVLFASVQLSMAGIGAVRGEPLGMIQVVGLAVALLGLGWLLAPDASAPPAIPAALMAAAGASWGVYSVIGRGVPDPVAQTARNFIGAAPLGAAFWAALPEGDVPISGLVLAIASGAVASGLGYVIWYAALPRLRPSTAGTVQLLVPVIAAAGGLVWLGEPLTAGLIVATLLILAGVALTMKR